MIEQIITKFSSYSPQNTDKAGNYTPASVVIPLYQYKNETNIVFTKRSYKVRHHKGQISFPGGKFDKEDENLEITAFRETYEELGIKKEDLKLIGKMEEMVTITNFIVTPYVGIFEYPYDFKISEDEIDLIIHAPLKHFLDDSVLRIEEKVILGEKLKVYFFSYKEHTIWGVTGKILYDFLNILREIK